jgi:hypothetical protein
MARHDQTIGVWDTTRPGGYAARQPMPLPAPSPTDWAGLAEIPHSQPTPPPQPGTFGPHPARPPRDRGPSGGFPA